MKNIVLKFGVVALILAAIVGIYFFKTKITNNDNKENSEVIKNGNAAKMINFVSENCYACRKMEGLMKEVIGEYSGVIEISEVDIMENEELASKYNIMYTPTQVFLDENGTQIDRHEGFIGKKDLVEKIKSLGVEK